MDGKILEDEMEILEDEMDLLSSFEIFLRLQFCLIFCNRELIDYE